MIKSVRNVFCVIILTGFGFNDVSFASLSCESTFQTQARRFGENQSLFAMTLHLERELVNARAQIAVSRMKGIIGETKLAELIEFVETDAAFSIKEIRPGLYSVEVPLRDKVTGATTPSEIMYALDNLIIVSIPGDIQQSNRVFSFGKNGLTDELPLGEFLIRNLKEPWVALSRSMRIEEATTWQSGDALALESGGAFYNGYDTRVYHFQLGLDNAYRSPGRRFMEFSAPKEELLDLSRKKRLWVSVNQANRGAHGLLFEIVIAASQISAVQFKVESVALD